MPPNCSISARAGLPAVGFGLTISVCALAPTTGSPKVGVMLTCNSAFGCEPRALASTSTAICALVWPAAICTDPDPVPPTMSADPR